MRELDQKLLDFGITESFDENDYYVSKSNYFAKNIIEAWPKWEKKIVNLAGEKYSGKTHLANIFINKHKGKKINSKSFTDDDIKKLKIHENIILDSYNNNIDERLLYALFNLVDQSNKYLIINSLKPINEMTFKLNDIKSRSKNCLFAKIDNPDDELMFAIILKSFSDRQILIDKKLIDFIIKRIDRSYGKIADFIYKVDELSLKKKKAIDLKIIKQIL